MHPGLIFLTLFSIILITSMLTCFICFIRSRRKEDEELMERQVQYSSSQQQANQLISPSQRQKFSPSPSSDMLINDPRQQQQQQQDQAIASSLGESLYQRSFQVSAPGASPFHAAGPPQSPQAGDGTRSDITQQINSAIIGSTEAEFQNDFIQVFPMYQIEPLPEKNTTPYFT